MKRTSTWTPTEEQLQAIAGQRLAITCIRLVFGSIKPDALVIVGRETRTRIYVRVVATEGTGSSIVDRFTQNAYVKKDDILIMDATIEQYQQLIGLQREQHAAWLALIKQHDQQKAVMREAHEAALDAMVRKLQER